MERSCGKLKGFGGAVAQLGARLDGIEEVVGSNPIGSTKKRFAQSACALRLRPVKFQFHCRGFNARCNLPAALQVLTYASKLGMVRVQAPNEVCK